MSCVADGVRREVALPQRRPAVFDDTDEVGVYTCSAPGYRRQFAANLADYAESDIAPRKAPDLGANPPGRVGRQVTIVHEAWPWLAAGLLVLLLFEWWAFHRRAFVN